MRLGRGKRRINTNWYRSIMKKNILIFLFLLGIRYLSIAQCIEKHEGPTPIEMNYFSDYPFPDVMALIGEPDTFFLCSLPSDYREFEEDNVPYRVNLLVYKKDGCWLGATIQEYVKKKVIEYRLTDTVCLHRDLDLEFSYMIDEMKKARVLREFHSNMKLTYVLTRDSTELYVSLSGPLMVEIPIWMDRMPDLASFVAPCLFKTYTTKVLKKYRRRR